VSAAARTFIAFAALALSLGSVPAGAQGHRVGADPEEGHFSHGPAPSHGSVMAPAPVSVIAPAPVSAMPPAHVPVTAPTRVAVPAPPRVSVTAPNQATVTAASHGSMMPLPAPAPAIARNPVSAMADAQAQHRDHSGDHFLHGHRHHRHHRHCCFWPFWGGVGVGIGFGSYYDGEPWYPGDVLLESPPGVYYETLPIDAGPAGIDLVIYPRNGQSPEQTEEDRRDCNRWAATQPDAVAHAGVFRRAVVACMDARGYTVR